MHALKTSLSSSENYQVFLEQEGVEWHNRGLLFLYTVYYLVVFLFPFPPFSTSDSCQCYSQETITSTITIKISLRLDCSLLVELIF